MYESAQLPFLQTAICIESYFKKKYLTDLPLLEI